MIKEKIRRKKSLIQCHLNEAINEGREFGIQTWALHPVVRGSIPRRSTIFIMLPLSLEVCNEYFKG
jgi:hypothetical protein